MTQAAAQSASLPGVTTPTAPAPGSPEFQRLMAKKSIRYEGGQFHPDSLEQWLTYAQFLIDAGLCPRGATSKTVALQCIQARRMNKLDLWVIANSYVINNRLTWFGSAPLALVMESGKLEDMNIDEKGSGDSLSITVTMARKGLPTPVTFTYTMADAKRAGSAGKGTYQSHPRDMIFHRAKGRVIDRLFGDVLGGFGIAEVQEEAKQEQPQTTLGQRLAERAAAEQQAEPEPEPDPTPAPQEWPEGCAVGKPGCSPDPADFSAGRCANHAQAEPTLLPVEPEKKGRSRS